MADINDYLRWRGDLSFVERPFNDVDNVICSALAYLCFAGIVGGEGEPSVRVLDACDRLLSNTVEGLAERICTLARIEPSFLSLVGASRRFGQGWLRDYAEVFDEDQNVQFAAVTIDLSPTESYVAFRGTDATLVGWREDFMMSFVETGAQRAAADYLAREVERLAAEGRAVYAGGHSKGGNLAVYAALSLEPALRDCLECVWSNDGPGMMPELQPRDAHALLGERYRRIVPAYSVVGMLFERPDEPRLVCESSAVGIMQHDPTSWQVRFDGMRVASVLNPESVVVNKAIDSWLSGLGFKERYDFTMQLFDALGAGGAERLDEIAGSAGSLQKVARAIGRMDAGPKDVIMRLITSLASTTANTAWLAAAESASALMERARRRLATARKHLERADAAPSLPAGTAS